MMAARLLFAASATAAGSVATNAVETAAVVRPPTFGPPEIVLFGHVVPVFSVLVAMAGVLLCRLIMGQREGKVKGDWYLTAFLMLVAVVIVVDRQPGLGSSMLTGGTLGVSGFFVIDFLRANGKRFMDTWRRMSDAPPPAPPAPPPVLPASPPEEPPADVPPEE